MTRAAAAAGRPGAAWPPGPGTRAAFAIMVLAASAFIAGGCSRAPKPGGSAAPFLPGERIRHEPELRVAVLNNASSVDLSADDDFRISGAGLERSELRFTALTRLTVRRAGDRLEITSAEGDIRLATPPPLRLVTGDGSFVTVEQSRYRGRLEVVFGAGGGLTVINRVMMEDYLRGVVPGEISHGDPALLEAVKAQAVAARTYAAVSIGQYESNGYDLLATVADQVYTGREGEAPNADRAIRETRGVLAFHHGEPIITNYASTCGGHTADRDEVWDKPPLPYLRGVSDRGGKSYWCATSRYFQWQERLDGESLWPAARAALTRNFGCRIPESARLEEIHVAETGPSGRVRRLVFKTDQGSFEARGDRIRWVLPRSDGTPLRSTLFELDIDRSRGCVRNVTVRGGGWGHGVGMCQWGAMERSRAGQSCDEILRAYYRGIKLATLY